MRVAVLAAGSGTRMGGGRPKILLEVGGASILRRHLDSLQAAGLGDAGLTVVTGFRRGTVERACSAAGVQTLYNPLWRNPGTLFSFHVLPVFDDPLLVLHGDLVWDPRLVAPLPEVPGDIVIPVDPARAVDAEAMKAEVDGNRILRLSKGLPPRRSAGESMGVFLIRCQPTLRKLSQDLTDRPEANLDDAVNRAADTLEVRALFTEDVPWEEVDTPRDLARARKAFE